MSNNSFRLKRGDTRPTLFAALTERDPLYPDDFSRRRPLDLTPADVVKLVAKTRDGKHTLGGEADIIVADAGDPVWDLHPELVAFPFRVKYEWQEADTEAAGTFYGELEITFTDSSVQTVPVRGYIVIVVEDDQG